MQDLAPPLMRTGAIAEGASGAVLLDGNGWQVMTTGHVFIATSLDGFIARLDGDIDWLQEIDTAGEDHGYDEMIESIDGWVMGRGTFEKVLTFEDWPYTKPVIVLSRTLGRGDIPAALRERVRLSAAEPKAVMAELSRNGWRRAYIDSGQVIQSFLREGLIATMRIARIPRLIGQGRPLFGTLQRDLILEHVETHSFPSGLVSSLYRVKI